MPTYYRNETLFSEIYLEEITRQPDQADALASLNVLMEYRQYANVSSLAAWKESYVHEVLSALGFYALAESEHLTRLHPIGSMGTEKPLSLCYVLLPGEDLDNTSMGRNWAEKIIRALREQELPWGLLTNGRLWRIYHLDEPTPYETYLEIDLDAILADKAKEAFQIFFKFMKAENFVADEEGKCQFDRFKQESQDKIDYIEKELSNALKQREEGGQGVLSDLCMGYVNDLRQRGEGDLDDEDLRKKIYHAAMLYMFRLLFLFYADARGLLSDENHALLTAVEDDCRRVQVGGSSKDGGDPLWERLEMIFVDIDQTYNGGLFSPQESDYTRFLSEKRIGDSYLAHAITNLTTYTEKNGEEKQISYRDMGVRHLGTLYEGLLEHKLFIAKEDTEVKASKGKVQFVPISQGGKLVVGRYIKAGEVYFAGDPSERKSTGSYYTPEYIVDYIVRNTVGEKLKELKDAFLKAQQPNLEAYARAVDGEERTAIANLLEENALKFVREQVLQLSVLDPAMGSGHFLVNAANLISNSITDVLNALDIAGCLSSGTAEWRRWVVENCIYGVDLNPLAVELAKLSLWILSMVKDQPLSFLNHHLKCGNSLVGARLEEIGNYPLSTIKKEMRQLGLFEQDADFKAAVEKAVARSQMIAAKASTSLEDVREKKAWLEEIEEALEGYKAICDVHAGIYFGNDIDANIYSEIVRKKDHFFASPSNSSQHYFHWEIEFLKVMLIDKGFTCIIGNPPYVDVKEGDFEKANFYCSKSTNLYSYFVETAIKLLKKSKGYLGFVIPLSIVCAKRMTSLREYILKQQGESVFLNVDSSAHPGVFFPGLTLLLSFTFIKLFSSSSMTIHSSDMTKFYNDEKESVLEKIKIIAIPKELIVDEIFPKIGSKIENSILSKMFKIKQRISDYKDNDDNQKIFYKGLSKPS